MISEVVPRSSNWIGREKFRPRDFRQDYGFRWLAGPLAGCMHAWERLHIQSKWWPHYPRFVTASDDSWNLAVPPNPSFSLSLPVPGRFWELHVSSRREKRGRGILGMMQNLVRSTLSGRIWPPLPNEWVMMEWKPPPLLYYVVVSGNLIHPTMNGITQPLLHTQFKDSPLLILTFRGP